MPYIYELPGWPALTWSPRPLAGRLAATHHKLGVHLGRMQARGFELRDEATLSIWTSEVVESSAIEGEALDPDEVRSSIAGRLGLATGGLGPVGAKADGAVEVTLDATQQYAAELTTERLFGWHAALFPTGRSGMGTLCVGGWRDDSEGPMRVMSGRPGKEQMHFEAPVASRVSQEMCAFLSWFDTSTPADGIIKAGLAHLWFLTIHPFDDGNGRIARALTDMALARADNADARYYSLSSQIAAERKDYYAALEAAQSGTLDATTWLTWFVGCVDRAVDSAQVQLGRVVHKARAWQQINQHPINDRQRKVINRLLDGFEGLLTTAKYAKLAKCSHDTALRDIQDLIQHNILAKNPAGGRSTSYRLCAPDLS